MSFLNFSEWKAVAYLILSFAVFAFFHSFMASNSFKRRFPWFKRAYYNVISLLLLLPFVYAWAKSYKGSEILYSFKLPYALIFYFLMLAGAAIFILGAMEMDLPGFIGIKKEEKISGFSRKGMHSIVRHPMYLGLMLFIWSFPELRVVDITGNLCITAYLILGAFLEERKLLEEFGMEYENYRKEVPMFIPLKSIKKFKNKIKSWKLK